MTARTVKGPDGLNKSGNGRGVGLATKIPRGKRTGGAPKTNYTALEARSRGFSTATISGASLVDPNKPLTEMQKEFVKHWASGETILSASVKAGYADGGTFAYRLCRMPNIIKLYNREKEKYEEAAQMSRKKVMDMLLESYEAAKLLSEPSSMVSAAREIGKMCGYYEPVKIKHEVSIEGKVVVERLNNMSDQDLLAFIAENARQIQSQAPELLEHDPQGHE
jgi:phage terminase small subunit